MPLKSLLRRSRKSLHRQQGEPKVLIGATEYNAVLSTLRRGEPIVHGGTEKTLETTVTLNRADHPAQPAIGSTLVIEDDNVRLRIAEDGVSTGPEKANWQCDCLRDGSEYYWLNATGGKWLWNNSTRLLTNSST